MLCGLDADEADQAGRPLELKANGDRCQTAEPDKTCAQLGWRFASEKVLHPSVQVGQYRQYLEEHAHSAFHEGANANPAFRLAATCTTTCLRPMTQFLHRSFAESTAREPRYSTADGAEKTWRLPQKSASRPGRGRPVLTRSRTEPLPSEP